MSKERDFHKLIENQEIEQKEIAWRKIQNRMDNESDNNNIESEGEVITLSKSKCLYNKRIVLICAAGLLLIFALFLGLFFGLRKNDGSDIIDTSNGEIRYCTISDYYSTPADVNLKQYTQNNKLALLYFDIYETSEYFADTHYKLNDTDEIICLYEEFYDENFVFVNFYITDNRTECDATLDFKFNCKNDAEIESVKVKWGMTSSLAYAMFEYNGYKYYLNVDNIQNESYILMLVETLLSK